MTAFGFAVRMLVVFIMVVSGAFCMWLGGYHKSDGEIMSLEALLNILGVLIIALGSHVGINVYESYTTCTRHKC